MAALTWRWVVFGSSRGILLLGGLDFSTDNLSINGQPHPVKQLQGIRQLLFRLHFVQLGGVQTATSRHQLLADSTAAGGPCLMCLLVSF
jgi:hypothetical protein